MTCVCASSQASRACVYALGPSAREWVWWELRKLLCMGLRVGVSGSALGWMQGCSTERGGSGSALPEAPHTRTWMSKDLGRTQGKSVSAGRA